MDSGHLFFNASCAGNMFPIGNREPLFRGTKSVFNLEETSKRQSFYSSPDELIDEEYYDEQLPEKKRRLSPDQVNGSNHNPSVHLLEKSFKTENKLEPERKTQLAKDLGLQPRQVAIWFQNRRARWKTKQLERDYDLLKADYDSLLSNYDSINKENEKLKSEVVSLNEKVRAMDEARVVGGGRLLPTDETGIIPVKLGVRTEDRLSPESVVAGEDGLHVDSGFSYFLKNDRCACMDRVDGMQSEEDEGSDDGRSYFPDIFATTVEMQYEEGQLLEWWVWS